MTRMHMLYRFSVTTGKCEDCGRIASHSDACNAAAPIRKIEELYDELDRLNLQVSKLRSAMNKYATHFEDCKPPCSCGLDAALAALPGMPSDEPEYSYEHAVKYCPCEKCANNSSGSEARNPKS